MSSTIEISFLVVAVLLVLSVVASKISDRFGIPSLLLFLLIGMLAGSEGIGGIYFDDPVLAQTVGMFALATILFSGGLDTRWESIRGVVRESLTLATLGVFITAFVLGAAAHWILGISLLEGLLLGAIVSSTDAAAVFSLLRSRGVRLQRRLAGVLEFESGSNDPMAVFLTVGLIQLISNPGLPLLSLLPIFFQQMLVGGLLGWLFGQVLLFLINRLRLGYEGAYPVLALGMLLLAFALTEVAGGSAFLAVYVVGLTLARAEFLHKRSLARFFDGMAWLLQVVMFLTLGLLVFPSQLLPVLGPGLLLAAILMLVARPLSVLASTLFYRFSARERLLISWVGLRGAVPIILATYPRLAGLEQSGLIFNLIFFVVLTSVLIQGTTIAPVARLLGVEDRTEHRPSFPLEIDPLQGWRGVLREVVVPARSAAAGRAIYEIGLPPEYLIVLISRGDEFLIPNGSIILQPGDRMLGLSSQEGHARVAGLIGADGAPAEAAPTG